MLVVCSPLVCIPLFIYISTVGPSKVMIIFLIHVCTVLNPYQVCDCNWGPQATRTIQIKKLRFCFSSAQGKVVTLRNAGFLLESWGNKSFYPFGAVIQHQGCTKYKIIRTLFSHWWGTKQNQVKGLLLIWWWALLCPLSNRCGSAVWSQLDSPGCFVQTDFKRSLKLLLCFCFYFWRSRGSRCRYIHSFGALQMCCPFYLVTWLVCILLRNYVVKGS